MTWAYFSVSAMRSCVRPAFATTSPTTFTKTLRREDCLHQGIELFAVLGHAGGGGDAHATRTPKPLKARIEQRRKNFAYSVGAEVEAQHTVAVAHAAVIADDGRHDELVAKIAPIGVLNDGLGTWELPPLRLHDGRIGWGNALPTPIAVHRVVAAANTGDRNGCGQCRNQTRDFLARGAWWRITAVSEGMHHRRHARPHENPGQCYCMILVRMHTA